MPRLEESQHGGMVAGRMAWQLVQHNEKASWRRVGTCRELPHHGNVARRHGDTAQRGAIDRSIHMFVQQFRPAKGRQGLREALLQLHLDDG